MSSEIRKVLVLLFCVANTLAIVPPFEIGSVADFDTFDAETNYRLPNNTKPLEYDIALQTRVDKGEFDFFGTVTIKIQVVEKTSEISLHYRQLLIEDIELRNSSQKIEIFVPEYDRITEILKIRTRNLELEQNKEVTLFIKYRGTLRNDQAGFYRSSYVNENGNRSWLATTQFESTNARHAFPCYDEPALKAKFQISITHGSAYKAISNMNGAARMNYDGTATTTFERTPLTSTYLIAFIVSNFEYVESNVDNLRHRVYANPTVSKTGQYALESGRKILKAIGDYVGVPYSLAKMDQAAIPDFAAGAMENWGLVTYREQYLLFDEKVHVSHRKTEIATIISHEFGHQWFGNLVSPKWWSYLWLNEGFATLFEQIGTDKVYPEWKIFEFFVAQKLQSVLRDDATPKTRPMTFYVEDPTSIANLFDKIAYPKSGSVLRMFLHALTEKAFQKGLKYYLEENSFKSATDEDLFNALEKAAKEENTLDKELNVTALFSSWSNQKGFPLVTVSAKGELTQERYTAIHPGNNTNDTVWYIPYNFITSKNATVNTTAFGWLLPNANSTKLNVDLGEKDWILLNVEQTGFYRVLYDASNYKQITNELINGDINKIPAITRSQLIDDLFDFVKTGRIQPSVYLDLIQYLKRENSFVAWYSASDALNYLNTALAGSSNYNLFRRFAATVTAPFYNNYTVATHGNESHYNKYLHLYATNLACEYENLLCLNQTRALLEQILQTGEVKSLDLRAVIYANGARTADERVLTKLWQRFLASNEQDERKEIVIALGRTNNQTFLNQSLERALAENPDIKFTQSERIILLYSILINKNSGVSLVIDALTKNAHVAIKRLGSLSRFVLNIADRIVTHDAHDKFSHLLEVLKEKPDSKVDKKIIDRANDIISERFKWLERHQSHFETYFKSEKASATSMVSSIILIAAVVLKVVYIN